jgi:hypothetical protein
LKELFIDWLENIEDYRQKGILNKEKATPEAAKLVLESIGSAI